MSSTSLPDRLLRRELGRNDFYTNPRGIYGDKKWVHDLDIVNELDGHSGCVNALSWSKTGRLLASGSDDTHLNIHAYQPDHTDNPFSLTTSVSTGHSANIFSVKFMPHSSDRTVVTCAGDSEIRVFDVEHATGSSSTAETEGVLNNGVRYLSEGDTNARVFRSHSDRVKRIVTESSPFLFLSCSEDGEVRQWDTRLPSSAYPRPPMTRRFRRIPDVSDEDGNIPPALISYKRHNLDLNTISCSPSQPYYIALGGAHLHCFLHDRRMTGRDVLAEQGKSGNARAGNGRDDAIVSTATKCVRKFAPQGQQKMKRSETGHITACKISDANPNELIASWSGDWIYNFDLVRSPDAGENGEEVTAKYHRKRARVKNSRNRKRKREAAGSAASLEGHAWSASKAKTSEDVTEDGNESSMALRVRYDNGQSEDIPFGEQTTESEDADAVDVQEPSTVQIAKTLVEIRKWIFALDNAAPTDHAGSFIEALHKTVSTLEDMDMIMRTWRYPVDPENTDLIFQNTLRNHRDRSRRFAQSCGTLSRLLAGQPAVLSHFPSSTALSKVHIIHSSSLERVIENSSEQFCYDFIKAICLWLESGPSALASHFAGKSSRRPLPPSPSIDDVEEHLIPYLLRIASARVIPNVDASRFEVDENRVAFESEIAAVRAFAAAIKVPFADLSEPHVHSNPQTEHRTQYEAGPSQDRAQATRYWGVKVARGVLMNAGEGINYAFVERAFGGLGKTPRSVRSEERHLERQNETINTSEEDGPAVTAVGVVKEMQRRSSVETASETREQRARRIHQRLTGSSARESRGNSSHDPHQPSVEDANDTDEAMMPVDDMGAAARATQTGPYPRDTPRDASMSPTATATGDDDAAVVDSEDDYDGSSSTLDSDDDGGDGDEDEDDPMTRNLLMRTALERSSLRYKCNHHVPAAGPQLHYEGAANARTVKDVNFYGLNDEYVVSGSDSGHLFIWDKASGELLNILEGDGEVVNVVQGHPYEPMLAVSGIDHSIKIFSSDKRARDNARKGIRINNTGLSGFSTLRGGRTRFGRARRPPRQNTNEQGEGEPLLSSSEPAVPKGTTNDSDTEAEEAALAPSGLSSRRRMHLRAQITAENDVDRRGGQGRDAFITRGMLAQLAARFRFRQAGAEAGDGDEGDEADGHVIEVDGDNIVVQGNGDCNVQ
ncbi:MAG: hypothetical protein Q9162_000102 [Coniocarpon cinnabarinum]